MRVYRREELKEEPVTHERVGLGPSRNDAGRDIDHRSSRNDAGRLCSAAKQARFDEDIKSKTNVLAKTIELAGRYLQMNAFCVVNEDPVAEIIQDFVLGFRGMKRSEFGVVICGLADHHAKERIDGAIREASWAGSRKESQFYRELVTSLGQESSSERSLGRDGSSTKSLDHDGSSKKRLGHDGPSTESLGHDGPSTKSLDHDGSSKKSLGCDGPSKKSLGQESPSMHVPALNEAIVFEWGDEKLDNEEYKSGIEALAQDLTWTLDEGVMAAKAIRTREEPEFHDLVKPGGDATRKTVLKYEFELRTLAKKKSGW